MRLMIKLKRIRKILNFKKKLSPNFSIRKKKIKYIILHYTGTDTLTDALNIFKNPNSKVSCHWLISKKGIIYKIVEEYNLAWHAGISFWKKDKMLNDISIGIELENKGHGTGYTKFSKNQIDKLENLLKYLIEKYNINPKNILGHSDIAPERKIDPGELFDWSKLAKKNLVYWPLKKAKKVNNINYKLGDFNEDIKLIKIKLSKIGYKCKKNNTFDISLKLAIEAFQRRFLPEKINGIIDGTVYSRIIEVSKNA